MEHNFRHESVSLAWIRKLLQTFFRLQIHCTLVLYLYCNGNNTTFVLSIQFDESMFWLIYFWGANIPDSATWDVTHRFFRYKTSFRMNVILKDTLQISTGTNSINKQLSNCEFYELRYIPLQAQIILGKRIELKWCYHTDMRYAQNTICIETSIIRLQIYSGKLLNCILSSCDTLLSNVCRWTGAMYDCRVCVCV